MNATIMWMTARGLLGRRRALLLLPLPVLLVSLALGLRLGGFDAQDWASTVLVGLGLTVLLPITALVVGTAVLGSEIDDGTIVHILTKPLPRRDIVLAKLGVAIGVSAVTAAVPLFVAGTLADSARLGVGLAVAGVMGAFAYSALFLLLSLLTKRPVLAGLVYILVWEGLLGRFVAGTRVLSIEQYVITIADKIAPTGILEARVSPTVSVVMTVIFVLGCSLLAVDRLRSFSMAGETS